MSRSNLMPVGITMLLGIGISCSLANPPSSSQYSQGFQFELTAEKEELLIDGLSLIKIGDPIARVKEILGDPTVEEELVGKKGEFNSIVLEYYIKRVEMNNVNSRDQLISLYFNRAGQLIKITKPF